MIQHQSILSQSINSVQNTIISRQTKPPQPKTNSYNNPLIYRPDNQNKHLPKNMGVTTTQ